MQEPPHDASPHFRVQDLVDLRRMCIPLDQAVAVQPGLVDINILLKLELMGYEQAPVYDAGKRTYFGLVETRYIRSLYESGVRLAEDDPIVRDESHEFHVGSCVTIFELLKKMSSVRAVVAIEDPYDANLTTNIFGLFTISDINRHPIRAVIYHLLADVEAGLAKWIELANSDPWKWISVLDEDHQAQILGYWELAKRQGVDVGPTAALMLAQILKIIRSDDDLTLRLG